MSIADSLRAEIARLGPIPFSRFMEVALYDPAGGAAWGRDGRMGSFGVVKLGSGGRDSVAGGAAWGRDGRLGSFGVVKLGPGGRDSVAGGAALGRDGSRLDPVGQPSSGRVRC